MQDYQIYTFSSDYQILHAGVHKLGKISHNTIKKLERNWQIWRRDFIANHAGNYPLKSEANLKPKYINIFPVNSPNNQRHFTLS